MSLEIKINDAVKAAMKAKEKKRLEALRAVKAAILIAKTESKDSALNEASEIAMLQKLIKQRRDAAEIYTQQNRAELAADEEFQANVIQEFLPKQLSEEELVATLKEIISQTGATSQKDMGKVMGKANETLKGKAEGKLIAQKVRELLNQ